MSLQAVMDVKDKEELKQLRTELMEETVELEKNYPRGCIGSALQMRHAALGALDVKHHRVAELEELERIESTARLEAMQSTMIDASAKDDERQVVGECPICLDDVPLNKFDQRGGPVYARSACCGVIFCASCWHTKRQHDDEYEAQTTLEIQNGVDRVRLKQIKKELQVRYRCPKCRNKATRDSERVKQLDAHAKKGKTWAQSILGESLAHGFHGVTKDRYRAKQLLESAANAGDVVAMWTLGELWRDGFPEANIPPSKEKADTYLMQAAKSGYNKAQYVVGESYEDTHNQDALAWYALSAAQGYADAQYKMSEINTEGLYGVRKSIFASIYWLRKAALNGHVVAQYVLALRLLEAKQSIFDGKSDVVGYSAHPEAQFWFAMFIKGTTPEGMEVPKLQMPELELDRCGSCGKLEKNDNGTNGSNALQKCKACQAILYCSKECQVKHWKMGHKVDCKAVNKWKESMKVAMQDSLIPA